ncbi:PE-PGRS family protein [Mycobacterium tuberculosis str. Beijing/NITR203]|nr:PE-PGRS family protein [Mycobacterium tuberculosis str. Beijing/NITR203]
MSWVMVSPELVVAAAADLAGIGSAISSANAAAAVNTTGLLTAGADEVSTAIAALFGAQGQAYQAASAQAAAFYAQFVQALSAGGGAYAAAEAAAVSPLLAPINAQFVAATGRRANSVSMCRRPRDRSQRRARRVVDRQRRRRRVWRPRRWGRR